MSEGRRLKPFFLFAAFFALADQAIKQIVDKTFALGEALAVVPGFFSLIYLRNSGGAFSILDGLPPLWGRLFFVCATLAALLFVFYMYRHHQPGESLGKGGSFSRFRRGAGKPGRQGRLWRGDRLPAVLLRAIPLACVQPRGLGDHGRGRSDDSRPLSGAGRNRINREKRVDEASRVAKAVFFKESDSLP